tara:strand:+ start:447 stop:590 length:144 start_codon:yes stop_codon:yes gene_type:complete
MDRDDIYNQVIQDYSELSLIYEGDTLQYIIDLIVDDQMFDQKIREED